MEIRATDAKEGIETVKGAAIGNDVTSSLSYRVLYFALTLKRLLISRTVKKMEKLNKASFIHSFTPSYTHLSISSLQDPIASPIDKYL